ncbi:hypothetical protein CWI42_040040 [Ordospora colligata]|uniref:GPI-anchored wall transfer protein n=1 Tax=Ordospora colligata OC4 TaxID=1354746 RepID=A0A0B2ULB7_9MICR|nr:uncharacterized protein M896_040040 [Ordospora colligata OC4]KHN69812.1 hypothetical protein M896_040040 [Ordospora colligata OC4]TBU15982.1 hypothetical protein CWI41_040040 [Ordospora colligata]TBU16195.1 hypothetical protein CWI40_040040 [Ordospora colligata]TBU18899.1 hypothetical protein CWI42_040040 [Ordospora colligata]
MNYLNEIELFATTGITHLSVLFYHLMIPKSMALEFLFTVIPQYVAIVFINQMHIFYMILCVPLVVYFIVSLLYKRKKTSKFLLKEAPNASLVDSNLFDISGSEYMSTAIDRNRLVIILCVAVAIFAADFPFYNDPRLGKSMDYGLKLMDIGVGSFVYNAGFFSTLSNSKKKAKNIIISFAFGALRHASKVIFKLGVDDAEFGVHLNFFFLLCILNILSLFINTKNNTIVGLVMCVLHETFLKFFGLEEIIYNNTRSNIFTANLEGIIFILPQMGMFLMASDISKFMLEDGKIKPMLAHNLLFIITLGISRIYSVSCRRIHNICFCMTIMILHTTHKIIFAALGRWFKIRSLHFHRFTSRHLLFILIWSNILTGINKLIGSNKAPDIIGHTTCIIYLAFVFYIPSILVSKPKKHKIMS